MENYEKRTKYLDYKEYDNRIRNGGALRTERDGEKCRVQISVRGLYPTDTVPVEIYLEDGEKRYKADEMMIRYGAGTYTAMWNTENLAGSGMTYQKWCGIVLVVSEHRLLHSKWETEQADREMDVEPEVKSETKAMDIQEDMREEKKEEPLREISDNVADDATEEMVPEREVQGRFTELYEDKWTQLQQHYRMIRPFGDGRTYLSITPKDFIVLGRRYQKLVSNSFLLHGYYNYGHLILVRTGGSDEYRYYLGVPGIYHEREKQAARMFGFEGFEGAVSPCSEGSFGYYMLQVEI